MNFKKISCVFLAVSFSGLSAFAGEITKEELSQVTTRVKSWPEESKKAADFMVKKYGMPDGITDSMLVWNNVKPFKKSIVYKEAVIHKFPKEHKDVLEHFIDYEAPAADKVAQVWNFDGSVVLERTKGEMSARCDREEANILALNLADDIIKGERSVEDARMEYGRQILSLSEGKPQKIAQKLTFAPSSSFAGDTDKSIMKELKTMQAEEEKQAENMNEDDLMNESESEKKHQDEMKSQEQ